MSGSPVHIPNRTHNAMVALQNAYKAGHVTGEDLTTYCGVLYDALLDADLTGSADRDSFELDFTNALTDVLAHENAWNAVRIVTYRAFGHEVQVRRPQHFSKPAPKKKATSKNPKAKAKAKAAAA